MTIGRRDLMLGGLGAGLAAATGPRAVEAREQPELPQPFNTYGIAPGGDIDQTASLQDAADKAAASATPFFLPPGNYTTSKLTLKSGTQIQGVPGASVLRYAGGGAIIAIEKAADIRLTGLTLAGEAKPALRSCIIRCALAATTASSSGAQKSARTQPSSPPTASSASTQKALQWPKW